LRIAALTTKIAAQAHGQFRFAFLIATSSMLRSRFTPQYRYFRTHIATCIFIVGALLAPVPPFGNPAQGQSIQDQSQDPTNSATLQGSVRDSRGRPVAGAKVYLLKTGTQTLTARTDSSGTYSFSALGEGVYSLRAEMAGFGEASFGPCVLGPKDAKKVDLTLDSQGAPTPKSVSPGTSGAEKPQFYDEPEFTVAGVTEAMSPGGHGSDTILRTTEALAKDTASLGVTVPNKESNRTVPAPSSSSTAAEESLRRAAESQPGNFEVNHRLGKLLVDDGKAREAIPYLERASQLNASDYGNAYELALAYADAGQYVRARIDVRTLLAQQSKSGREPAELHRLLGDVEEKLGNPLEAVREYQRAAEMDPSEPNFFDWGTDLLMHRAVEPAIEVFTKGNRLFPRSVRMLTGLSVAWYARGAYDQAAQYLCAASDLNPDDANPYLFLGKMGVEAAQSECVVERLHRFSTLQPENALANYYYAVSLSRRDDPGDADHLAQEKSLLEKAVRLDPKLGAAYVRLGVLYSQRGDSSKAIAAYQRAIEANPESEEAHYRLAQTYIRNGEKSKAHAELQIYQQLSKKTSEEVQRERREIQQFVYTLRDSPSASRPQ
jgi:tetratricopeptide (TPR) repeat protein